jgi:hypothetical protein
VIHGSESEIIYPAFSQSKPRQSLELDFA